MPKTIQKRKTINFYDPFSLGLRVSGILKSDPRKVLVHCIHHIDNKASAIFNVNNGTLFCFSCHKKSNAKEIASLTGGFINYSKEYFNTFIAHEPSYNIQDIIENITRNEIARNNNYLKQRGLTNQTIEQFGILQDNESVYFPVPNYFNNSIGYVGRRYRSGSKARYVCMFEKEKPNLFNLDFLSRYDRNKRLYIVENFFAVPRGIQAGKQVFSTFGSSIKTKNLSMLARDFEDIVLLFDNDQAGYSGYAKTKICLPHAKLAFPIKSSDELLPEEWEQLKLTNDILEIRGFVLKL